MTAQIHVMAGASCPTTDDSLRPLLQVRLQGRLLLFGRLRGASNGKVAGVFVEAEMDKDAIALEQMFGNHGSKFFAERFTKQELFDLHWRSSLGIRTACPLRELTCRIED